MEITSPPRWQENLTTKWNEHARTDFPKYFILNSERVGNETEGCVIVRSLEPFYGQGADEIVRSEMEYLERRGLL